MKIQTTPIELKYSKKLKNLFFTALLLSVLLPSQVNATIYQPGETLEPDCAPESANCGVATSTTTFELNGQSASTQSFATTTSGVDFTITSSGGVHTFSFPDASILARGLVTIGSQTFGGNKTFNDGVFFSGNFSTPRGGEYNTTGTQDDVDLGVGSYFHYGGNGDATFTGIAGGVDGRIIHILNDGDYSLTLTHNDIASLAVNRIETSNGLSVFVGPDQTVSLMYDAQSSNWHVSSLPITADSIKPFAFIQGGNGYGTNAILGTTDASALELITSGSKRFTVATSSATLTGTGVTTLTTDSSLALSSAASSALTVTSGTVGALTLDSGTTGAVNIGTNANAKIITIGNSTGATALNLTSGSGGIALTGNTTIAGANTLTTGTGATTINSTAVTLAGNSTVLDMTGSGTLGLNTTTNRAITTGTGLTTLGGDLVVSGDDLFMGTNTSGNLLVADGTNFNSVVLSGDATINGSGVLTLNYAGGQSASATLKGFLTSADWNTFNNKQDTLAFTPEDSANKSTNILLGTSNTLYPSQNAVKTYVDNLALGFNWKNPVEIINVIADTDTPVGAPSNLDVYIINTGGDVGDWAAFNAGDMIQYQTDHWEFIKALVVGDRFGVSFKSATTPSGSMTGYNDYSAQITGGSAGAFTYTFTAPVNNDALYVNNANAYYHNVSFVYSESLSQWVQLSASVDYAFGNGLQTVGASVSLGNLTSDWNQASTFDITTAGDINLNSGELKTASTTATLFNTNATTLNIGGAATAITLGAAGATVTGSGALTLQSAAGTVLTLDSGTIGAVNIGTGNNAKTLNLGTGSAGNTINIGTNNTTADAIAIGSALDAFSLSSSGLNITTGGALTGVASIDTISYSATDMTFAGTGTLSSTGANALTLDSGTTGAVNIGTNANAKIITIGNSTGATALNLTSGSGGIALTGNTTIAGANTLTTGTGATTINSTAVTLAGNSTVLDMTGSGTLGLNTTTNRAITTGTGLLTAGGALTSTGTFTAAGNFNTPKGTDYATTGSQNDVDLGPGSLFRYTGAGTATFTGITGGIDGRFIRIINASGSNLVFANENVSSIDTNRITTGTGANLTVASNVSVGLQYDSGTARWRVVVLPATSASINTFAFVQGGNAFGTTATLGTTDANALALITSGNTRFTLATGATTLTGTGATTLTTDNSLALSSAAASTLSVISGTTGALVLDSGSTGAINIGTSTNAKIITIGNGTGATSLVLNAGTGNIDIGANAVARTINLGTGAAVVQTINVGGTGANVIGIGNTQTAGSISLGAAMTGGTVSIGGTGAQTGNFDLAPGTGAQTITLANNTGAKTINIGGGISGNTISLGNGANTSAQTINIGAGAAGANSTVNILTGVATAGTQTLNLGTGASAKTITIGNTTGASALSLNAGSGNINLQVSGTGTTGNVQVGAGGAGSATPDFLVLDVKSTSGDPTGTAGAMYYNSNTGKFRCFENSAWVNCTGSASDLQTATSFSGTNVALGTGATSTLTTVNITPTTATGDAFVQASVSIRSASNTDGTVDVAIRKTDCTGTVLANMSEVITEANAVGASSLFLTAIEVDPGASSQTYALCGRAITQGHTATDYSLSATIIDTGADYAEIYTTNDETLEPGDVVALDPSLKSGVQKSSGVYDHNIIGIVSTRPGMLTGSVEKEGVKAVPIALSGRVPVKVSGENGAIQEGDFLTSSSLPGVAMKANGVGSVIGQAMTGFNNEGTGVVLAFVKNFAFGDNTLHADTLSATSTFIALVQSETPYDPVATIAQKIADGLQFTSDFVSARVTAIRGYFDELFTTKIHTEQLCVKKSDGTEVCVTGDQLQDALSGGVSSEINNTPEPAPNTEQTPEVILESEVMLEPEVTSEPEAGSEPEVTPEVAPEPEVSSEPEVAPVPEVVPESVLPETPVTETPTETIPTDAVQ